MKSVNKVILLGNVTRDAELKSTQNGQSVCTFGLATNRVWKDQSGVKHFRTEVVIDNLVLLGPRDDAGMTHAEEVAVEAGAPTKMAA